MGGGGTETTTSRSGSPEINRAVDTLGTQLNTALGAGVKPWDKGLYAGISGETRAGLDSLWGASNNSGGIAQADNWARGVVGSGGYNPALQDADSSYRGIANAGGYNAALRSAENGYQNIANSGGYNDQMRRSQTDYQGVADAGGYNQALTQAQNGIQGYLRESQANAPGYSALRQRGIDDALTGVGSSFLTDGRFGSSAMGDAAGEAASDVALGFDYQNYTDRLGRQFQGNQALAGIGQTALGNRMGAISGASGIGQAALGNQMGALSGVAGVGQTAMGNQMSAVSGLAGVGQQAMGNASGAANSLPGLFQAGLMPAQAQLQAGQILDADAQSRLSDQAALFDRTQNAGWNTLERASGIVNGSAGAAGTSTTSPTAPWWQNLLGAGAMGAGIFGSLR